MDSLGPYAPPLFKGLKDYKYLFVFEKVAFRLKRKMRISKVEIAYHLGVGTSAIAMAIQKGKRAK